MTSRRRGTRMHDISISDKATVSAFWAMVNKSSVDGCWEWCGAKYTNGYGRFSPYHHLSYGAHRVSYTLSFGSIPQGLLVLHRCDNPPCVRPDHLFIGTAKDNALDRAKKGRGKNRPMPGEHNPIAKLTATDVRCIRELQG